MTRALMTTVLLIGAAVAQPLFSQAPSPQANDPSSSSAPAPAKAWEFSVAAFNYVVPDETNYVSPYFKADRDWLHLEARYNYEDQRTGSGWIGYNFQAGNNLVFDITPMVGVVFGRTDGVAPGALMSITYKKFDLSTETEYVFDADEESDSFLYTWSELGYSPVNWLRVGLAGQRTRAYETPLDVQRGIFAGVSYKSLDFTTYVFNLGWTDPTVVLAASFRF
jgi:hypothetical protein